MISTRILSIKKPAISGLQDRHVRNGYALSLHPQQGEAPPTSMIFQEQGCYRHRHYPRLALFLNSRTS
ncbi:hypothetical protein Dpoa2040_003578 [Dickeya sp. CFBP 2040]|nr:hypothetical protein [Dickeya sp. CFBP 2040]